MIKLGKVPKIWNKTCNVCNYAYFTPISTIAQSSIILKNILETM